MWGSRGRRAQGGGEVDVAEVPVGFLLIALAAEQGGVPISGVEVGRRRKGSRQREGKWGCQAE